MSVDRIDKRRIAAVERQERLYKKALMNEYAEAYKAAKNRIMAFISEYGADGKLSSEVFKYGRYEKLISQIMLEASKIRVDKPTSVNRYLKDQFETSYLFTGYGLEAKYQELLAFKPIKRSTIDPLSITGKVSLQQNADIVRSNLVKAITQSIAGGEGIGDTSKRVKLALERNMNNSLRVARTETTTALNDANLKGMEKAQKKLNLKKQWVATLDGRTRDRHRAMDGETVPIDKPFSNGLMYPGDQSGPPAEVINCRCAMIEVLEDYENPRDYRRARGTDGRNKKIPYATYEEWYKNRL